MNESQQKNNYLLKSKFVRTLFVEILAIFVIISIVITVVAFYSFASEIKKKIILDRQNQLSILEDTISKRMEEVSSIAYNVGIDPAFHIQPIEGRNYTGYEMSSILSKYLVGNSFINYLAFYRLTEPDTIYTSIGELSFKSFWSTYFNTDMDTADAFIKHIQQNNTVTIDQLTFGEPKRTFFAYTCPLPQMSSKPQAFILMLISVLEIEPLIESQFIDSSGELVVFDNNGKEMFHKNGNDKTIIQNSDEYTNAEEIYKKIDGIKYVIQKRVSKTNGWIYISAISLNKIISNLANKQILFIMLLLVLVFIGVAILLISIVNQYKPISNLAVLVNKKSTEVNKKQVIDEQELLVKTFAALKDDSEQKKKFENAYYEAEAANKAKSAFFSSMSHDIRTPMNAIIGMTALALNHSDDNDYVKNCLQKVKIASQYLLDIINNVLDMSRIESGRFSLTEEVVELPKFLNSIETILTQSVEAKKIILQVQIRNLVNPFVICDNVRMMQVFMNILSNAVKFTPEGGKIIIDLCQLPINSTQPDDNTLYGDYVFTFTDTGIGISPEFIKQVFDTFSRAKEAYVDKVEGTGLGMAIAKSLVELMGGTISCSSILGKGTTFVVKMHLKLDVSNKTKTEIDNVVVEENLRIRSKLLNTTKVIIPDLTGKNILVAEDNFMNREIALKIISETKAKVTAVVNGKEALDVYLENPEFFFDIILMDLQMPVMDGYEATSAIRALQRSDAQKTPIFALTASSFDEDVKQVKKAGMNGHISKPYTPEGLYTILTQILQ